MLRIENLFPVNKMVSLEIKQKPAVFSKNSDALDTNVTDKVLNSDYRKTIISNSVNDVNYIVSSLNTRLRSLKYALESLERAENSKDINYEYQKSMEVLSGLVAAQMKMESSTALMAQANVKLKNIIQLIG